MVTINPVSIVRMLMVTFNIVNTDARVSANSKEIELHDIIRDMLLETQQEPLFSLETDTTLEFLETFESHSVQFLEDLDPPTDESFEADEGADQLCLPETENVISLEYKTDAVAYWKSGKKRRLSLTTVQEKFRKVSSVAQLYRWELTVNSGGTQREKLHRISEYVYSKFVNAVEDHAIIHDLDLRRWALQAKEEIGLTNFKASDTWIRNFKRSYRIVSRKVNKFITRSYSTDSNALSAIASDFVRQVQDKIKEVGVDSTFNADESGFNFELHSGRTLMTQGTKSVAAIVQSLSAITHSYTILPTISASGKLHSPLFITLKEPSGNFGPRVEQSLLRPENVYITASTSGKLTNELFNEWLVNVYVPNVGAQSILLLDSWTGHSTSTLQQNIPPNKKVELLTIPKKTTGMIQPLDVFGFRIWKNFVRKFSDLVILFKQDIDLHARNNVIRLQSLVHNQLSAPRYHAVFAYAWYKSGYIDQRPNDFENPVDFAFSHDTSANPPRCRFCGKHAIIRCAWCGEFLCFQHFFEEFHQHGE